MLWKLSAFASRWYYLPKYGEIKKKHNREEER